MRNIMIILAALMVIVAFFGAWQGLPEAPVREGYDDARLDRGVR